MTSSSFLASPSDGKEILRILESSAAKGSIELIYTRRPDAYASYEKEVGEARVFLSKKGEMAVGTCAELVRQVYIGGKPAVSAYLTGLKKDASYTGSLGFGARFIRDLWREDIDSYFCSVVAENTAARDMFEKGKRGITMSPLVGYTTYILSPKVKIKAPKHPYAFRRATQSDLPALLGFLKAEGSKKDLFPVIEDLQQCHGLCISDFYLLLEGERILAAAALWNQSSYKQYVVKKYRGIMKLARLCNPLLSLLGYIKLPKENIPLSFPMLSFFLSLGDDQTFYRIFLAEIKKEIQKTYGMFVIGLPKTHFAHSLFARLPSIHFDTALYAVSFPWSDRPLQSPDPERVYPECALL